MSCINISIYTFDFRIGEEIDSFPLEVNLFSGNASYGLYHQRDWTRFSTWDNDHDHSDNENCAIENGGGWWFSNCRDSCLTADLNNLRWQSDKNEFLSLKSADMYIRPKSFRRNGRLCEKFSEYCYN